MKHAFQDLSASHESELNCRAALFRDRELVEHLPTFAAKSQQGSSLFWVYALPYCKGDRIPIASYLHALQVLYGMLGVDSWRRSLLSVLYSHQQLILLAQRSPTIYLGRLGRRRSER